MLIRAGGVGKQSTTSGVIIRSVSGMGMYSNTAKLVAINKINSMLPKICVDNGCQAAISVKFKIGMAKGFRPSIDFITSTLSTDIGEFNAGKGKKTYAFRNGNLPLFTTKQGLVTNADISGSDKGTINQDKYFNAFTSILDGMCNSYSYLLKEELSK